MRKQHRQARQANQANQANKANRIHRMYLSPSEFQHVRVRQANRADSLFLIRLTKDGRLYRVVPKDEAGGFHLGFFLELFEETARGRIQEISTP